MKEIGGYIEWDKYELPMLHEGSLALNCGRNCLAYLIRARRIRKILLPKLLGDSVSDICKREHVCVRYYSINIEFQPTEVLLDTDEWIYVVNYYGQLSGGKLKSIVDKYKRVIVDQAHSYFQMPVKGIDNIYICKKFFGVVDGAFLYTDASLNEKLVQDESYDRVTFLMGRYEKTASEFYKMYIKNEMLFYNEPIKKMSKLTKNMLHGINYDKFKKQRTDNFSYLHNLLKEINKLQLVVPTGAFMYPLYIDEGKFLREQLIKRKIYVPIFWPNVLEQCEKNELEYDMACNILPLPVDQRYGYCEMDIVVSYIKQILDRKGSHYGM